jgi:hypothetical protein
VAINDFTGTTVGMPFHVVIDDVYTDIDFSGAALRGHGEALLDDPPIGTMLTCIDDGTLIDCDVSQWTAMSLSTWIHPTGATPAQTVDGQDIYDTTNDWLTIGDGAAPRAYVSVNTKTDENLCSYESATKQFECDLAVNAGTDLTADLEEETHASEHAVSAADTVFPADPNADRYLMWDDDPGALTWGTPAGGSGDVESAGDCTGGACLDGTSDGGTYIRLYDESGFYVEIDGNAVTLTANRQFSLPNSGGNISVLGQTITDTEMAAADFGDFTCTGVDDGCTVDSGAVDLSELAGGAAGANAYDFGGVTSLEIPNGNNPTTDAAGEVALDVNDHALEIYAATASRLIPSVYTKELTILEPDLVQAKSDAIPLFRVDVTAFPFGITVTSCYITLAADAAYVAVFEEWTGDPPAQTADIETVTTGAGDSYMEDTSPANPTVEADNYVYVDLPTTDVPMVQVQISYTVKEGN